LILSICLPNRNQSSAIEFTLKYILTHRIDILEGIEIIISDNSSSDDSVKVISKYGELLDLQIYTQQTNIGFLGQLLFLSQKARGRYLLFLGAGDLVDIASLKLILNILREGEFSILTYEASEPDSPFFPEPSEKMFTFVSSVQEPLIPFFSPAISCNIFQRSDFLQATSKIPRLRNEWPHGQIALNFAKAGLVRGHTSQQILQVHPTDSGWGQSQFAYDVLIEYDKLMRDFVSSVPESADLYGPNIGLSSNKLNRFINLRLRGVNPSRRQMFDLANAYRRCSLVFMVFLIAALLPTFLLRLIHQISRLRRISNPF
jgi:glycosyltransferase involved in cell wall biosynthesis